MSTGAFFLMRLGCRDAGRRGLLARSPQPWGPAQRLKCWSEDGNPASHGAVKLRLRKPSNAPQGQRIAGYGSGQVSGGLGPAKPLKLRFFAKFLVGAWRRRGCRLKRLLRRWGPGGKRSRDTPPIQARLPGLSSFAFSGNQSAQQARLPGLCRTNTALLLQTCPILISMLGLGF